MLRVYLVPSKTTHILDEEGIPTEQIASVSPDVPDGTAMVAQQVDDARYLVMVACQLHADGVEELVGDAIPDEVHGWSLYQRRLSDNGMA